MKDKNIKDVILEQLDDIKTRVSSYSGEDFEKVKKILTEQKVIAKDKIVSSSQDLLNSLKDAVSSGDEKVQENLNKAIDAIKNVSVGAYVSLVDEMTEAKIKMIEKLSGKKGDMADLMFFLQEKGALAKNAAIDKFTDLIPSIQNLVKKGDKKINDELGRLLDKLYKSRKNG